MLHRVCMTDIKFDQDRETDRHYVEGPLLAVLIVVHPDYLLYHPPTHASEVEDRLFWRIV